MDKRFGMKIVAVLSIGVMLMTFFALVSTAQSTNATAVPAPVTNASGATIVMYEAGEPEHLDPAIDWETAGGEVIQNTYDTLFFYNSSDLASKPVGLLARGYDVSADGTVYTIYLKDDLKFANGDKLNASAVKYSWDRGVICNLDPWNGEISTWFKGAGDYMDSNQTEADVKAYKDLNTIKVINETTLQVTLSKPYPYFIAMTTFTAMAIVNPNLVEANGGIVPNEVSPYLENATAGSGAFVLDKWAHEDSVTLVKNPNYWRGPAKVDKVIIKYVSDYNTRLLALQKGDADFAYIPTVHIGDVKNDSSLVIEHNPQFNVDDFGFNQKIWPLGDANVRKALIESFDTKKDMELLGGYRTEVNGFLPKGFDEYDASVPVTTYNPTDAKALLTAFDFKSYKEPGLSGDINRFLHSIGLANNQTTVTLYYNAGNDNRKTACLLLKDQVDKYDVGLKIDVQELDWPTYMAKSKAKALPIIYLGWLADYGAPDNFAVAFATSKGDCARRIAYTSTANDGLYTKALSEFNLTQRKAYYTQMLTNVNQDYAYAWRGQPELVIVHNKNVKGYTFSPPDNYVMYYYLSK